ncbi:MAG: DUF2281 domain-containing protein [Defluviitaleaceae bacterium]|nr:DUF2281 domain-containing protein [Defluviitaleaceae bacterium]
MQAIKGFYKHDGSITLSQSVGDYTGEIVVVFPEKIKPKISREELIGCMRGKGWIADDFNEPIEEMAGYM